MFCASLFCVSLFCVSLFCVLLSAYCCSAHHALLFVSMHCCSRRAWRAWRSILRIAIACCCSVYCSAYSCSAYHCSAYIIVLRIVLRIVVLRTVHCCSSCRRASGPARRSSPSRACTTAYTTGPRGDERAHPLRALSNAVRRIIATASFARSKGADGWARRGRAAVPTNPAGLRFFGVASLFAFHVIPSQGDAIALEIPSQAQCGQGHTN